MPSSRPDEGEHGVDPVVETALDAELEDSSVAGALGRAYLLCHREDRIEVIALHEGTSTTLGRAPDAEILIDSPRVSRYHARLTFQRGELHIEDLGSRNGTRVNREVLRSTQARVVGGDVLKVGPLEVVVARADQVAFADDATEPGGLGAGVDPGPDPKLKEHGIIVADPAMVELFGFLRRLASSPATVLILGETGAGKEVVAEQIHRLSPRAAGPFVAINCASLPSALFESELFGHEKGAFTGADRTHVGYFEAADGGTLLLDEIGEMPILLQAKLLRVLEHGRMARLGATKERTVDVRVLCATHRDLATEVHQGRFRQDLYYRIATFSLRVPPLRERPREIQLLADLLARRATRRAGLPRSIITPAAAARLLAYSWPGNVRELRNAMEHAVVMANGAPIEPRHLPESLRDVRGVDAPAIRAQVADVERASIEAALAAEGYNRTHAAKRLGISRRTLIYKMVKYGLRDLSRPR